MDTYKNLISIIERGMKTRDELLLLNDTFLMADRYGQDKYLDIKNRIDAKYPKE